jgi:hypothetical protein
MATDLALVAIPDTDGELLHLLRGLEDVLLALVPFEPDDQPAPIGLGPDALEAVQRIWSAVSGAERGDTPELIASDGRFELVPLRFVKVEEAHLAAVSQAVTVLRLELLPAGDEYTADVLREFSDDTPDGPGALVAGIARAQALIDLDADNDSWLLHERIADQTGRVVLSPIEEAAYKRLTDRVLEAFHVRDPLARFVYRGQQP